MICISNVLLIHVCTGKHDYFLITDIWTERHFNVSMKHAFLCFKNITELYLPVHSRQRNVTMFSYPSPLPVIIQFTLSLSNNFHYYVFVLNLTELWFGNYYTIHTFCSRLLEKFLTFLGLVTYFMTFTQNYRQFKFISLINIHIAAQMQNLSLLVLVISMNAVGCIRSLVYDLFKNLLNFIKHPMRCDVSRYMLRKMKLHST